MLDSNKTQESRKVIHIWGSAGNEGKTAFIKHKLINSRIFGYFSPLFNASQTATALIAAGQKSYYFADIPRAIRETSHLSVMAEQLKDGIVINEKLLFL